MHQVKRAKSAVVWIRMYNKQPATLVLIKSKAYCNFYQFKRTSSYHCRPFCQSTAQADILNMDPSTICLQASYVHPFSVRFGYRSLLPIAKQHIKLVIFISIYPIAFYIIPQIAKVHGANTGPTWVLWDPDGPHVGPMNLAIRALCTWLNRNNRNMISTIAP